MSSTNLPGELVEEILTRLPVKSLLRFRCVSTPWKALIDSPNFIKSHLSKNLNSKCYLLSLEDSPATDRKTMIPDGKYLVFEEVDLMNWSNRVLSQAVKLPLLFPYATTVIGSCNGLIALGMCLFEDIILVNPLTREYQLLPRSGLRASPCNAGLCYDCSADEYKLVVMTNPAASGKGIEVNIWGSKSNTWRQTHLSPKEHGYRTLCYFNVGKYIHGALHWIVDVDKVQIASFDLITEKFQVADYDGKLFGYPKYVTLEVLGGCICLRCYNSVSGDMDIWMMKEYGVTESWCKLGYFSRFTTPLALSDCGRGLLFRAYDKGSLHWYDLENKSKQYLGTKPYILFCCPQSLVRLPGKLSQSMDRWPLGNTCS